ncbi:MAG: ubiquinone/menaquinone biosynthesis methyltransferase [Dehalococcoidia bacterium]|nr:ubiquinone/menaquinone biosynthesis methyltransferase [Dehalococcoidia bacterium]
MKKEHPSAKEAFTPSANRADYVKNMFGSIANRYDFMNSIMTGGRHHFWRRLAAEELVTPGDIVVDVGCGTGDLSFACLRQSASHAIGIDFARPMLPIALDKAKKFSAKDKFTATVGDATSLPIANDSVDVWCSAFVIRNIPDMDAAFHEAWRILKPGGKIAILEITKMQPSLFSPIIRMHFNHIVPFIGKIISRHNTAYEYLPVSVDQFETKEELCVRLDRAGFNINVVRSLMFRTITLLVATKPKSP